MQQKTNVCGVISLNFAIISILFSPCIFGSLLFAIPAFILGIIGTTKKNMQIGTAISGIIMSIFGASISAGFLIFQGTFANMLQNLF